MTDIERWLAGGADRLPAAPTDIPDVVLLTLLNRDQVIAFLTDCGVQAREPDDLGDDVVLIELPTGRRQIVMPGELVTRTDNEIIIGRNGSIRAWFPRPTDTEGTPE